MFRLFKLKMKNLRQPTTFLGLSSMGLTLGAGILTFLMAGEIYNYKDTVSLERLPQVDAIVCLGGGRGRIAAAAELWNHYFEASAQANPPSVRLPVLYFAGMGHQASWGVLAKQMRKGITQKMRPEEVIIEKESSNTDSNARWLVRFAQEYHWKKILLITSSYHMKRARFIFEELFKVSKEPIHIETISVYQEPYVANEWRYGPTGVRVTVLEYLKWVYYRAFWRAL